MRNEVLILVAVLSLSTACGRDDPTPPAMGLTDHAPEALSTEDIQLAFLQAMVPHHEMAIQMARMAASKAKTPDVKRLANEIIEAQSAEIDEMKRIHQRLFGAALQADMMAHDRMGMSMKDAGMDMDMNMLESAADFDRMFLQHMIPHHEGAIRMAREVLNRPGVDTEVATLATRIMTAQQNEVEMIKGWL